MPVSIEKRVTSADSEDGKTPQKLRNLSLPVSPIFFEQRFSLYFSKLANKDRYRRPNQKPLAFPANPGAFSFPARSPSPRYTVPAAPQRRTNPLRVSSSSSMASAQAIATGHTEAGKGWVAKSRLPQGV